MILTCPECATRYSVPDQSVGPEGRTVRCASCGLTWRTERDPALTLAEPAAPTFEAAPELGPGLSGDDLPRAFRERIAAQRRGRKVAANGVLWAVGGVAAAAVFIGVLAAREHVVAAWPKSASAFATVGLKVNSVGLEIEEHVARTGFTPDGKPTVLVTGRLRNVRKGPVTAPPLRFEMLDAKQQVVATRITRPLNAEIPAGEARTFQVSLENPPESTHDVFVRFHLGAEPEPAKPVHTAQLRPPHAEAAH